MVKCLERYKGVLIRFLDRELEGYPTLSYVIELSVYTGDGREQYLVTVKAQSGYTKNLVFSVDIRDVAVDLDGKYKVCDGLDGSAKHFWIALLYDQEMFSA